MGEVVLHINEVDDFLVEDLGKGEGRVFNRTDAFGNFMNNGLMFGCPRCGRVATGPHTYDVDSETLKPSIVCNGDGCGYHGHLKNGVFDKV